MISMAPFLKLMVERDLDIKQLSQISGITEHRLASLKYHNTVNQQELDILCRVLNCQPCDLVEVRKSRQGGHWEWIND